MIVGGQLQLTTTSSERSLKPTQRQLFELSIELGVSQVTVVSPLKKIGKRKKLDKWVPHHLTDNHQNRRLEVASLLPLRHRNEPIFKRIMTCDEEWIFFDNTRKGGQWLDIDELPGPCPRPDPSPKKVMVSVWWGVNGIIHFSFLKTTPDQHFDLFNIEINNFNVN
jgi:histone-lysine N-methyltransferase SETMAR